MPRFSSHLTVPPTSAPRPRPLTPGRARSPQPRSPRLPARPPRPLIPGRANSARASSGPYPRSAPAPARASSLPRSPRHPDSTPRLPPARSRRSVNGHQEFPTGGQRNSPGTVMRIPHGRPWVEATGTRAARAPPPLPWGPFATQGLFAPARRSIPARRLLRPDVGNGAARCPTVGVDRRGQRSAQLSGWGRRSRAQCFWRRSARGARLRRGGLVRARRATPSSPAPRSRARWPGAR